MQTELPSGLIWYPDSQPGISRRRAGRGFSYTAPDGTTISDRSERARLKGLGIPPAYEDVWISPKDNGHLVATGRDTRERKQYRYHPEFSSYRARTKYDDLARFGEALPRIRRRVMEVLRGDPDTRDFAVAAVLRLMDRASLRVGSTEYAEDRKVYGATTLRGRHVTLSDDGISLRYRGKGNQLIRKELRDTTLARALQRMDDLPGGALMQWADENGQTHRIGPETVNAWLRECAEGITAKTFRTWNGTVAALEVVLSSDEPVTIKSMSEAASQRLHNTPTIARNSYIHPDVIDLAGETHDLDVPGAPSGLRRAERALLALLG